MISIDGVAIIEASIVVDECLPRLAAYFEIGQNGNLMKHITFECKTTPGKTLRVWWMAIHEAKTVDAVAESISSIPSLIC